MDDLARIALMLLPVLPAFWLAARVREVMSARHGQVWFKTEQGRNMPAMLAFLWSSEHRRLNDADLSLRIWQYRAAMSLGVVVMLVVASLTSSFQGQT